MITDVIIYSGKITNEKYRERWVTHLPSSYVYEKVVI